MVLGLAVERRIDLGHFLRLERVARSAVAAVVVGRLRRAAEVEAEACEAVAVVAGLGLDFGGEPDLIDDGNGAEPRSDLEAEEIPEIDSPLDKE